MAATKWSGESSRKIVRRIVVEGTLVLQTPAHFGGGEGAGDDSGGMADMTLLVDPRDGRRPLLPGSTLAGALRSHLRTREQGAWKPLPTSKRHAAAPTERESLAVMLFGDFPRDDRDQHGRQSQIIVEDAVGENASMEWRSGVAIAPESRTAEEDKLFWAQVWPAGTTFPLRLELLITEADAPQEKRLKQALAAAVHGLESGDITLGARKRRGFGRVSVTGWRVKTYDLTTTHGLLDWLANGAEPLTGATTGLSSELGNPVDVPDARHWLEVKATFGLDGSMLVRSGMEAPDQADMAHICARQADGYVRPVLPGTSLAGALRARAHKIAGTIAPGKRANDLVDDLFGPEIQPGVSPRASRITVEERVVASVTNSLVQNRVAIDRFTGGAYPGALFNEQPLFSKETTEITVVLRIAGGRSENGAAAPVPERDAGLVLLLLKDLWTGDLPVGGETGIGRGRLCGKAATITWHTPDCEQTWTISAGEDGLALSEDATTLEGWVTDLNTHLSGGKP